MPKRLLFLLGLLATLGCRREAAPAKTSAPEAPTSSQVEGGSAEAEMNLVLAQLTVAVRKFAAEQRRVPKSLDELVGQGDLARLPEAPPGKSFGISKDLQVYLRSR